MSTKLIVALDFNCQQEAERLIDQLDPKTTALKVGNELFTCLGVTFVKQLIEQDFNVFLDLKFHDIPNTVAQACKAAADLGVWMVNVHALGGEAMLNAARDALESYSKRPLLIAVTVLTSLDQPQFKALGFNNALEDQVMMLAQLTAAAGLDGIVCSANEVPAIKKKISNTFLTVTPGIRLDKHTLNDQKRVVTPANAQELGSDFLVVGRPITKAERPAEVVETILSQLC